MKKLTILLFSILISFNSFGVDWVDVFESDGTTFYIDKDSFKKHNENVYWWDMKSLSKPIANFRSITLYKQGECGIHRFKVLAVNGYKRSMAKGSGKSIDAPSKWKYPEPKTVQSLGLTAACEYAE
jgi:hypothetical protein